MVPKTALAYPSVMAKAWRDLLGTLVLLGGLAAVGLGVVALRDKDYLATLLLFLCGLAIVRAGTDLLIDGGAR